MPLLYLLRHGEIESPRRDCFIGHTDVPLSSAGRDQILAWRDHFRDVAFRAVWSSNLLRAVQSAKLLSPGRESQIRTSRELRELNLGEWEGLPRDQVRAAHPDLWKARGENLSGFRPPGGESFGDLQRRVIPCIRGICAEPSDPVLVATHAGVIRVLICAVLDMPLANLFKIRIDYASLTVLDFGASAATVRALNMRLESGEKRERTLCLC
jgi:probable phosphoglycerate mutase